MFVPGWGGIWDELVFTILCNPGVEFDFRERDPQFRIRLDQLMDQIAAI